MIEKLEEIILKILQNKKNYVTYFRDNRTKIVEELEKIKKQLTDEV